MIRRSRLEIYFDILKVIESGFVKPTQIMYQTNLSWVSLQDMLETLITNGFIKEERKGISARTTYKVTDEGRSALSYHLKALDGFNKAEETFQHII